ncbi:hypothetical protein V6N13_110876 [Hibiscus sabdariffa]
MIIWRMSKRHNFEVSSAYLQINVFSWDENEPIWEHIWILKVPQRIRLFLLLTYWQRLMSNSERCQRGVGHFVACPRCPITEEIVLLTLRYYKDSKEAWLHLIPWELIVDFFQYDLHYLALVQSLFICIYPKG